MDADNANEFRRQAESSVYAKEIWNAAIEAAAKLIEQPTEEGPLYAATIRKLKK